MMSVGEATEILMALALRLLAAATAIRQRRKRPPRIPRPVSG